MNTLRLNKETKIIYSIPNFLSSEEIDKLFELIQDVNFVDAGVGRKQKKETINFIKNYELINPNAGVVKRIRNTNIKWIEWTKNFDWLFEKIIMCINTVNMENYNYILKFVENLQFAQYTSETKGFYSKHNDCGNEYDIKNFVDIRKLSFSIQLSDPDEYEGGELKLYRGEKSIYSDKEEYFVAKKDKGTIIFFPSNIFHEVTPVTKGTRYSLVSWVQGPNLL